jgi:general stress protein 26
LASEALRRPCAAQAEGRIVPTPPADGEIRDRVLRILAEHSTMTIATVRPDGWPQATMVGFASDDLDLYFVIARTSQKYANIARDPRVSIAIGGEGPGRDPIQGLSLAARAVAIIDPPEVERFNALVAQRYPDHAAFAPEGVSAALMRARPEIIAVTDRGPDGVRSRAFRVAQRAVLLPL